MRLLYRLLLWLALPLILMRLVWRGRRQPAYLRHWAERFGFVEKGSPGSLWIHAVSVGETRAAEPLTRALRQQYPGVPVLLTCMTPTGRDTAMQLFGDAVTVNYLPYDLAPALTRFLRVHQPRLCVLMETELWPELIHQCRLHSVPVYVVNARLSERSAKRYGFAPRFIASVVAEIATIAAQSEADAGRFRALGATRVEVTGNLKFDRGPSEQDLNRGAAFRQRMGGRSTVLAASTRQGEEAPLLRAWRDSADYDAVLVVVPRHPQRFDEVAELIQQAGLSFQRRSDERPLQPGTQVWLGDSMGEMFSYFAAADVALIGGSFEPLGGQNLLEACAVGTPVVVGPHMFNFTEATQLAVQAGAALQAQSARDAMQMAIELLRDGPRCQAMGAAGRALLATHQGATQRTLRLLGV